MDLSSPQEKVVTWDLAKRFPASGRAREGRLQRERCGGQPLCPQTTGVVLSYMGFEILGCEMASNPKSALEAPIQASLPQQGLECPREGLGCLG